MRLTSLRGLRFVTSTIVDNRGLLKSLSTKRSLSVEKTWAASIISQNRQLKPNLTSNKTPRPVGHLNINNNNKVGQRKAQLYRRRLEDQTWTTEPMDDKLIWVDCEMTGLDYNKEMIMEIGIIITNANLEEIARQPSIIVHVEEDRLQSMDLWCIKHHGESGLTEACRQSKISSEEVDDQLIKFVEKHTKQKECPMAGNSIYMDRIFIAKQFPKFHSHFHYRNVDVSTIKELVRRWYPGDFTQAPKKKFSHRVMDDILDSISELKYYRSTVFREPSEKSESKRADSNK